MDLRTLARRSRGAGTLAVALMLAACGGGGGGGSPAPTPNPPTPPPPPTVSLSSNVSTIEEGESVQLTWSSTNSTSCVASGGWTGPLAASGTQTVGPLTVPTNFVVTCTGSGGTAADSVLVNVLPPIPSVTIEATPRIVRDGQTSQLTWTTQNVTACEASASWSGSRPLSGSETVGPFTQPGLAAFILDCTSASGGHVNSAAIIDFRAGVNQPPVANAGPDRSESSAQRVELNASGSTDDHALASSSWTQVAGPAVTLGPGFTQLNASFTAPIVTADTVLTFSLTVTDDEGATSAPDSVDITIVPIPPIVTLSGDVLYERVPHGVPGTGLSYAGQGFVSTAGILLEVLDATTQSVVASGSFPGEFHFDVPSLTDLRLRATATLSRQAPEPLPHWQISVRDLDAAGLPLGDVYSYTGPVFNSGPGGRQTLQIPSGWSAAGQLIGPRAAAPFAILDSIRPALDHAASNFISPHPDLPPLLIDWSPTNRGGDTFFQANPGGTSWIVLAGEADVDTDEYDPSVIRHEFGHFILHSVSRDDSIGGAHSIVDRVDMRVAASEGFATAYGALVAHDSAYSDSFGLGQHDSGFFDIGFDIQQNEGWYNEASVQEVLWQLQDLDSFWTVINGPVQQADAMVSPFVLFSAYRQLRPDRASTLDFLLQGEGIVGPTIEPYGSTETNSAGSVNVLPVYTPISLGGSVQVRSTDQFGVGNKLSTHRFLRLSVPATASVRFQATAAVGRDVDMLVFRRGASLGPSQGPANEDFSLTLDPGDYVIDVYDCGNADCNSNVTPGPVDITVSVTTN